LGDPHPRHPDLARPHPDPLGCGRRQPGADQFDHLLDRDTLSQDHHLGAAAGILRPAHPEGHGGENGHQTCDEAPEGYWPNTRIVWRGDSHYGRVEAMDWAGSNDTDDIFGLAGNVALDDLVAEAADNLSCHHAMSGKAKLRTFASFMYRASSWKRPRKVVGRLEYSLQPVPGRPACAGRSTSVTSSPRSKARRSISTRTSVASAGRWRT
jgi:hypothetical protein